MEAEKLKVIAEGMGYRAEVSFTFVYVTKEDINKDFGGSLSKADVYNPLTNNDQMVEIMERLKVDVRYCMYKPECECTGWYANIKGLMIPETGKTINEAVVNAAYEYFK